MAACLVDIGGSTASENDMIEKRLNSSDSHSWPGMRRLPEVKAMYCDPGRGAAANTSRIASMALAVAEGRMTGTPISSPAFLVNRADCSEERLSCRKMIGRNEPTAGM